MRKDAGEDERRMPHCRWTCAQNIFIQMGSLAHVEWVPVTTAWRFHKLWVEETASRYYVE
jgi:hypothetical protein